MGFNPESYTFMTMGRLQNLEKRYGQMTRDLLFSAQGSFPQRVSKSRNSQRPRRRIRSNKQAVRYKNYYYFGCGQLTRDLLFSAQGSFPHSLSEGRNYQRPRRRIRSNKQAVRYYIKSYSEMPSLVRVL